MKIKLGDMSRAGNCNSCGEYENDEIIYIITLMGLEIRLCEKCADELKNELSKGTESR